MMTKKIIFGKVMGELFESAQAAFDCKSVNQGSNKTTVQLRQIDLAAWKIFPVKSTGNLGKNPRPDRSRPAYHQTISATQFQAEARVFH